MNRLALVLMPVFFFFAALAFRILSWHSVFQPSGIYPNGNDAYYHFRRIRYSIEHFPAVLNFDPLMNFPEGAQPIWPPTMDWLFAAFLLGFPDIDQPGRAEAIAVWIPPLIGAATVVFVYFMALRFFCLRVAIVAAAAMVVLPAHSLYSRLGVVDHHVLVASAFALMLALLMELFRGQSSVAEVAETETAAEELQFRPGLCAALGLSMAVAVLIWPGSLLYIGILQIAMLGRLLFAIDADSAKLWALRFALIHGIVAIAVFPMSAGNEWRLWGTLSPVVLSNFQPLYFLAGAVSFGSMFLIWRMGWGEGTRLTRAAGAAIFGFVLLGGLLLGVPALAAAITDALSWFAKDEEFQSAVNESIPLFGGRRGAIRARTFLSYFVYVTPFAMAYLAWQFRNQAERLLLLWCALALFLATLLQWRFMNSYSIAYCLVIGLSFEAAYQVVRPRLFGLVPKAVMTAVAIGITAYTFAPSLRAYRLNFENVVRSWHGEEVIMMGTLLHTRFVADAARFLRDHSPAPEPEPYSVLGPWGDGHILKYIGRRGVVQDNFGDDVAPENFKRAEEYFSAPSEAAGLEILASMSTRYVLIRSTGSGHSDGYVSTSLFSRMYSRRGTAERPRRQSGRSAAISDGLALAPALAPALMPALRHHRLVYQSEPIDHEDPRPYVMLFEVVSGAELRGRAEPGSIVSATIGIKPRAGFAFEFAATTITDATGVYQMTLPYSNEAFSPDVHVDSRYRIQNEHGTVLVSIPEAAVLGGTYLEAPDLR